MHPDLPRTIRFWGATAVMVGIIIGSGIFRTPPAIAEHLGSPAVILLFWLAGGVLALCGALTYAELATMHPESGGVYVFLREGYGRWMAFVFGWTYLLITKPFAAGGIAIVFAEHLNPLLGVEWDKHAVTIAVLGLLTVLNIFGLRLGSGVAGVLTSIKIGALVAIVALAAATLGGRTENLAGVPGPTTLFAAIAPVMAMVLWTYDGWSDAGAIAGEVKDPQRNLPRIYIAGTVAVTALYLAVNAVYMWIVPLDEMRGMENVAPVVATRLLGGAAAAGAIVSVVILLSTLGSSHGSIITGARVSYAQARDGLLFRPLAHVNRRFGTPDVSLVVQYVLSCAAVLYASQFEQSFAVLSGMFVFTMWIFYGLAGAAVFILRVRRPDAPRPFRCPGYPLVPGAFVLSALAMTALTLAEEWRVQLPGLLVLVAAAPAYLIWRRFAPVEAGERTTGDGHS